MLQSRLPEIARELGSAIKEAELAGAELVVEAAKARVPVETGRLRDAIHIEHKERGNGIYVVAGDREAFYGLFVEHGSARGVPPHPFLVPALEENRGRIQDLVGEAIRRIT
jgi:HK97 gp10 family phage protein